MLSSGTTGWGAVISTAAAGSSGHSPRHINKLHAAIGVLACLLFLALGAGAARFCYERRQRDGHSDYAPSAADAVVPAGEAAGPGKS